MDSELQHFGGAWEFVDAWNGNRIFKHTHIEGPDVASDRNYFMRGKVFSRANGSRLIPIMPIETWRLAYAERGTETP